MSFLQAIPDSGVDINDAEALGELSSANIDAARCWLRRDLMEAGLVTKEGTVYRRSDRAGSASYEHIHERSTDEKRTFQTSFLDQE